MDTLLKIDLKIFNKLPLQWKFLILSEKNPYYLDDIQGFYPEIFEREHPIEKVSVSNLSQKNSTVDTRRSAITEYEALGIPYLLIGFNETIANILGYWFSPECSRILKEKITIGKIVTIEGGELVIIGYLPEKSAFAVTSTHYFIDLPDKEMDSECAIPATA